MVSLLVLLLPMVVSLSPQAEEDLHQLQENQKLIVCSNLVRLAITDITTAVHDAVVSSRYPREQTYDKMVAVMLNNCYSKVKKREISLIYSQFPEDVSVSNYAYLVDFDVNYFKNLGNSMKYTPTENSVLGKINTIVFDPIFKYNDNSMRYIKEIRRTPLFRLKYFLLFFVIFLCVVVLLLLMATRDENMKPTNDSYRRKALLRLNRNN